jgi:hypothetical protein
MEDADFDSHGMDSAGRDVKVFAIAPFEACESWQLN